MSKEVQKGLAQNNQLLVESIKDNAQGLDGQKDIIVDAQISQNILNGDVQNVSNIENNEEIAQEDDVIKYKLEDFEGPLDLLLHLVKEKKKDIMEIKLSEITDQYLAYVREMKERDMEVAAEFLVVAAKLLEIKSFKMLPVEEIPEDDTIDPELAFKLNVKEYELFKEASENLHNIENVDRFYKLPDKSVGDPRIVFNDFNLEKMLDAFAVILMRTKDDDVEDKSKKISKDRWTVAEKLAFLKGVLQENKEINFFSLFDANYSRLEIITVFLAVLELLRLQYAEVVQTERYEDMIIKAKEGVELLGEVS